MADFEIAYDRREIVGIAKVLRSMEDESRDQARSASNALATFATEKIKSAGYGRTKNSTAVRRIVDGVRVSKTSTVGEFSYGFATQRFSGGATTRQLWPGFEFGSNKFKQFPAYSGRFGRGSRGWFIYPTLRAIQPDIVRQWEESLSKIMQRWDD